MNFNIFQFKGELGRFLGELDDNMVAFVLTGDSGAGKSYFSYSLAKLLLSSNKTVKYYSLEEGIGNACDWYIKHKHKLLLTYYLFLFPLYQLLWL